MAFLFATSFYLLAILFYSMLHCLPIEGSEETSSNWNYEELPRNELRGFKAAAPTFGAICNRFTDLGLQTRKILCLLCNGFQASCFIPTTTPPTTTTTASTTLSTSTTSAITTTAATTMLVEE